MKAAATGDLIETGPVTPAVFRKMMTASATAIYAQRDHLCELDGAIGDGDHGVTMEIGFKAAMKALEAAADETTISALCDAMGQAFLDAVGASAGPLYATAFFTAGQAVSDRRNLDAAAMVAWLAGFVEGIGTRGGAVKGDKTMMDAWLPAIEGATGALKAGQSLSACIAAASDAAKEGAQATVQMQSNRGRSKKLGARSVGHMDPGAASAAVMISAWADVLGDV